MNMKTKGLILAIVIVGVGISMFATTQALASSNQTMDNQSGTQNNGSWCFNKQMHQHQYRNQTMEMYQLRGQHGCGMH
ncbi:MAG: hypothetical protein NWE83_05670 [Candidatus Bathyarchaeota archaeon]|jgi:hypothetical protein|nr:hypothetical protein [Candidatus Bathyarchaeota archaeon]